MLTSSELSALATVMLAEGSTGEDTDRFYTALALASKCKGEACAVRVGADWWYVDTFKSGEVMSGRPIQLVDSDMNPADTLSELLARAIGLLQPGDTDLVDILYLPLNSEYKFGRVLQFGHTQATLWRVRIVRLP